MSLRVFLVGFVVISLLISASISLSKIFISDIEKMEAEINRLKKLNK